MVGARVERAVSEVPADAYRAFATAVGLITTHGPLGPNVMAAEWTFNVSYDPFLIMVVLEEGEATYDAIVATKEFGVSLCSDDQFAAASLAGHFTRRETDKLSSERFETYAATHIRAPLVRGAILNAECKVVSQFPVGDHVAFVGEAIVATWDPSKMPLVLHRGYRKAEKVVRPDSVSVTATPARAGPGTNIVLEGEFISEGARGGRQIALEIHGPSGEIGHAEATTDGRGFYEAHWTAASSPGPYRVIAKSGSAVGGARLVVA